MGFVRWDNKDILFVDELNANVNEAVQAERHTTSGGYSEDTRDEPSKIRVHWNEAFNSRNLLTPALYSWPLTQFKP